ncbi:MAG: hypothetical protein K2H28_02110 [Ruminococcus sp.]|nr:hypothetical protein [Ruminococcus sp.]
MEKIKKLTVLIASAVIAVGGAMSLKRTTLDIDPIKQWNYCNKCGECHDYADCGRPDPNMLLSHDFLIY